MLGNNPVIVSYILYYLRIIYKIIINDKQNCEVPEQ